MHSDATSVPESMCYDRLDRCPAVSFLNSRMLKPDEDDYKKLIWVVKYLDSSVDMPLVLAADDIGGSMLRSWFTMT